MPPSTPDTLVLAGDIGGTKTNLAIFRVRPGSAGRELEPVRKDRFVSSEFPGLNAIIRAFLKEDRSVIKSASFGVPGPVTDGRAKPTNLTWGVDAAEIAAEFRIPHVTVLNDLAANAYGIGSLKPSDLEPLNLGAANPEGNRCVVSPGTGLGEAGIFWDGRRYHVWACEGGHADFSARNELEAALLLHLAKQFGHVSAERVISGQGIHNIYNFLRETGRAKELPSIAAEIKTNDPGYVITAHAEKGDCPLCIQTVEIFANTFAAEAGNMALKAMATGGVYLGGGIPIKLLWKLKSSTFVHAFVDKGRLRSLMEAIPLYVILNDEAALLGAARAALDEVD
jgi:glucokinase